MRVRFRVFVINEDNCSLGPFAEDETIRHSTIQSTDANCFGFVGVAI